MKCPIDNATLVMTERNGVEIDYCPTCRGVWLDRGELDKILARAAAEAGPSVALSEPARAAAAPAPEPRPYPDQAARDAGRHDDRRRDDRGRRYDDDDDYRPRHKRRESFLSDLFDF